MTDKDEKDILIRWESPDFKPLRYYLEGLLDDWEGFRVLLRPEDNTLPMFRVKFEPLAYRNTPESFHYDAYRISEELRGKTFYAVENSSFLDYFHKNSSYSYTDWDITHYVIYTDVECIEVLSAVEPETEWLGGGLD